MIRLLIADDHAAVRRGLKQLFGMLDDVVVAAEAEDGEQALQAVRRGALDLALVDLSMPGLSGIELIERIRAQDAHLPVLVLSMHGEPQIVQRALDAGAQGYLVKGCDAEQIVEAVRRVAAGVPRLARVEPPPAPPDAAPEWDRVLSPFGTRVALLLAEGCTPAEIARRLGIRLATVRRYVECAEQARQASVRTTIRPDQEDGDR